MGWPGVSVDKADHDNDSDDDGAVLEAEGVLSTVCHI